MQIIQSTTRWFFIKTLISAAIIGLALFYRTQQVGDPGFQPDLSVEKERAEFGSQPADSENQQDEYRAEFGSQLHETYIPSTGEERTKVDSQPTDSELVTSPSSPTTGGSQREEEPFGATHNAPAIEDGQLIPSIDSLLTLIKQNTVLNRSTAQKEELITQLCVQYSSPCEILHHGDDETLDQRLNTTVISLFTLQKIDLFLVTEQKTIYELLGLAINAANGSTRGMYRGKNLYFWLGQMRNFQEFLEVETHELGHLVDLDIIRGKSTYKSKQFTENGAENAAIDDLSLLFYKLCRESESTKKANISYLDFVSGYAQTNPFEDFAETVNFYLNHNQAFQTMTQQSTILNKKYRYMKSLFWSKYINKGWKEIQKLKNNNEYRPRDTTRI